MKITNYRIGMESVSKYSSLSMDAIAGNDKILQNKNNKIEGEENKNDAYLKSSFNDSLTDLMKRYEELKTRNISPDKQEMDTLSRIRTECINYLIRILFGVYDKEHGKSNTSSNTTKLVQSNIAASINTGSTVHYLHEEENLSYSAKGTVMTADGRTIDFGLSFEMSRSFEEYYEERGLDTTLSLCDPLVINLDSSIPSISDQKFLFDIDSDGIMDNIHVPGNGSGFLALDKNNDGIINDGSELFGTASGDGFRDLAQYDSDGNGWIDENDEIFDKLLIYSINPDGSKELCKLSKKDVGAIFLGNVAGDFSMNDSVSNNVQAKIRKTGVFLFENGNVGTIQHLDLAKA